MTASAVLAETLAYYLGKHAGAREQRCRQPRQDLRATDVKLARVVFLLIFLLGLLILLSSVT